VRSDTGKRVACHPTRKKAEAHLRALYANEPAAAKKAIESMDVVEKSVQAAVSTVESDNPNGEFEVVLSTEAKDRDGENLWIDEWKQPLPERIHIDGDHGRSIEKTVGSAVPRIEGNRLIGKGEFAGTPYAQMVRQLVNEGHIRNLSVNYGEKKNQKDGKPLRELYNAAFVAIPANPEAVVLSSKAKKDDDGKKPYGDVTYADPGYQEDGKKRYPLDSEDHVRSAWSYINQRSNASQYSAEQLSNIKSRIRSAAKKFGIEISGDDEKSADDVLLKQIGASGNNPSVKHDDMVQAIHDAACHLGAQCANEIEADSGEADGANKSLSVSELVSMAHTQAEIRERFDLTDKSSTSKEAGSPQESTEEPTAPTADQAAGTADQSADDAVKAKTAARARALAYLIKQASQQIGES
jgi:hypothetical protein